MQRHVEIIDGAGSGSRFELPIFEFVGRDADSAPSVYIQAALHAGERPGVATLHKLIRLLRGAEAADHISGRITIVPTANPIGESQRHFHEGQGRFDLATRINFNRDFPLLKSLDEPDIEALRASSHDRTSSPSERLKARLLVRALSSSIILDLHCDDESLPYLYVPSAVWPAAADLAGALGAAAVILGSNHGDGTFEDAAIFPYLNAGTIRPSAFPVVATVELRGLTDVTSELADHDATSLYRFLAGRGAITDPTIVNTQLWSGTAIDITQVELVRAPVAGTVIYHAELGALLSKGQPIATIISDAGDPDKDMIVSAPQSGMILTRRSDRFVYPGDQLVKLTGKERSLNARTSTLEF